MFTPRTLFIIFLGMYGQATFASGSVSFSPGIRRGGDVYHKQESHSQPWAYRLKSAWVKCPSMSPLKCVHGWITALATLVTIIPYSKRTDKSVGIKWMPQSGTIRPNFGAGFVQVRISAKHDDTSGGRSYSAHDTADGYYVDGGVA